eukprot:CAMPEP_0183712084 /NCGR_PEP_ID=MMETSP0737-20130205/7336_1 /TAXON_ID=385413 /ORGANISM="Thalassiosira miniscula, Strain CCMP1093" /LENGTH=573 /DNA_ID=CAMNT_0025940661 /DNA_START=64 /DNA_END=1785 /DNA_ORIENTATION=-
MYSTAGPAPKKKKSRQSEIALLEKISTSLDTYIGDNPGRTASLSSSSKKKKNKGTSSDASKNAAKNFLAAKTLVRNIAKACAQEKVSANAETEDGESDVLFDSLVEEYKDKYPSLTKRMLLDGIVRYNATINTAKESSDNAPKQEGADSEAKEGEDSEAKDKEGEAKGEEQEEDDDDEEDNDELKFGRIIERVDMEMEKYHERVEALKRSREKAALEPEPEKKKEKKTPKKRGRKRKADSADGSSGTGGASPKPKKAKPSKPKKEKEPKDPAEVALLDDIVKRYAVERAKHERLPNGVFEEIVEDAKRENGMEDFDMPLQALDKKVRFKYNKLMKSEEGEKKPKSRHRTIVDEVYARYSRTKEANGGKLPPGTMDAIIEGVKLEYGLAEVKLSSLKTRCQARFTKENPEFQSNPPDQIKIGKLSSEDKRRRQVLINEVTSRYVREKEAHPKKLADGTLDRIIEQTKEDLGITEFDVPKASIRGRINRKSHFVQTLGSESPYNAIDEPLVTTINSWLSQGISVTRAQGLDLANRLLKGKRLDHDSNGAEIVLDAKWWRNFLERNKRKLVCSSGE